MRTNQDGYLIHIRELSGPRPLRRATDIGSEPRTYKAGAISFETRTIDEIMGPRKNRNLTSFRLTKSDIPRLTDSHSVIQFRRLLFENIVRKYSYTWLQIFFRPLQSRSPPRTIATWCLRLEGGAVEVGVRILELELLDGPPGGGGIGDMVGYNGTIRTPSAVSGPGYLLQTAQMGLQSQGHFVRNSDSQRNYGVCQWKDRNPTPFRLIELDIPGVTDSRSVAQFGIVILGTNGKHPNAINNTRKTCMCVRKSKKCNVRANKVKRSQPTGSNMLSSALCGLRSSFGRQRFSNGPTREHHF